MYTVNIAFYGAARLAAFEAPTATAAIDKALAAVNMAVAGDSGRRLQDWAAELKQAARSGYAGASSQYGYLGLSYRAGGHDPWLDSVTVTYPPCSWLDYSESAVGRAAA